MRRSRNGMPGALAALGLLLAGPSSARAQATASVNPHGNLPTALDCGACHTAAGWTTLRDSLGFDHSKMTAFPLKGRHAEAPCAGCHLNLRFDAPHAATIECASCHLDVHQGTLDGGCASCHNTTSFQDAAGLDRHARTTFPLTGAHVRVACEQCHAQDRGGVFSPLDATCLSCHRSDFGRGHENLGGGTFDTQCQRCHQTTSWKGVQFDHAALGNGFALQGRHQQVPCESCHTQDGGVRFQASGADDCIACHQADYDANHTGTGFPTTCASCHTVNGWDHAAFDHLAATGFPLVGAHALTPCASCHDPADNSLLFPQPSSDQDCVACHQADYDANHAGTGFPTTCASCHTATQWQGAAFDHSITGFTLLGAHTSAPCASCHNPADNSLLFPQPSSDQDCVACHEADYDANHTGTGFPLDCTSCHNTTQWQGATFNHTWFPINSGKHANLWNSCATCHTVPTDYSVFTCMSGGCHGKTKADNDHSQVNGYAYDPVKCLACHPTGN